MWITVKPLINPAFKLCSCARKKAFPWQLMTLWYHVSCIAKAWRTMFVLFFIQRWYSWHLLFECIILWMFMYNVCFLHHWVRRHFCCVCVQVLIQSSTARAFICICFHILGLFLSTCLSPPKVTDQNAQSLHYTNGNKANVKTSHRFTAHVNQLKVSYGEVSDQMTELHVPSHPCNAKVLIITFNDFNKKIKIK